MAAPTAAPLETGGTGGQNRRGPFLSELWVITGVTSVATNTVAITPRFIKNPVGIIGPVGYSVSGQVITAQLLTDLGTQTILVEIVGRP
jgi:hypothetical protein